MPRDSSSVTLSAVVSMQLPPTFRPAGKMHVHLSHARRALVRCPFTGRRFQSFTALRGTSVEAKRGAKALLELEDEKVEDAAGMVPLNVATHPRTKNM